jgi:hypothetical protein
MSSHTMSGADAAWLHMDRPTNLMVINSVLWFGKVTVGFLTDAGLVPDPQTLADSFRAHLLALAREVQRV